MNNRKWKLFIFLIFYVIGTALSIIFKGKENSFLIILFHLSCILLIILFWRGKAKLLYTFVFITLAFIGFLFSTFFVIMKIEGTSMEPDLKDNSLLMVWQQDFNIERNDILLLQHKDLQLDDLLFKRVVGLPGDHIDYIMYDIIGGVSVIKLNGVPFLVHKTQIYFEINLDENNCIKEGYYFVIGNDVNSYDSRRFGFIEESEVLGKVLFSI